MELKPPQSVRPVLSERAARWIVGEFDSTTYFALARQEAASVARTEVVSRLHRSGWWDRAMGAQRIENRDGRGPAR